MLKHDITRCVSLLDLRRVESSTLNTHQEGQKKSTNFKFSLESLSKCILSQKMRKHGLWVREDIGNHLWFFPLVEKLRNGWETPETARIVNGS